MILRDFFLSLRFTLSRDKTLPETSSLCFLSLLLVTSVSAFNYLRILLCDGVCAQICGVFRSERLGIEVMKMLKTVDLNVG